MIIINSADYVISELQNEIGKIPPVFLPVGNKHVLKYQVSSLREKFGTEETIYVTLPKNYVLSRHEINVLENLQIKPMFVRENLSLGMALIYVLNSIGEYEEDLFLLHGDTIISDIPTEPDVVSIGRTSSDYKWRKLNGQTDPVGNSFNYVWSGFFSFSSIKHFLTCLAQTQGNFVDAVSLYSDLLYLKYVHVNDWYDVGHVNTYFNTRCSITTQRAFNSLRISDGVVWKSGDPAKKIQSESHWFQNMPSELKRYIPQFIEEGERDGAPYYVTEFVSCLPLNELFVYGRNSVHYWSKILDLIFDFMYRAKRCFPAEKLTLLDDVRISSQHLLKDKTLERLNKFAENENFDLNKSVRYNGIDLPSTIEIANQCIEKALDLPVIPTVLHGDLCLSNIIYDSRSENIKVIDPRGLDYRNNFSIYGNQIYDLAKLFHSIVGMYDFIIADLFELTETDNLGWDLNFREDQRFKDIQVEFMKREIADGDKGSITMKEIAAPTVLLFLSMIPLHYDKPHRQKAMLVNAYRLYSLYVR